MIPATGWEHRLRQIAHSSDYVQTKEMIRTYVRDRCRDSFKFFAEAFEDPGFYDPDFHDQVCDFFQKDDALDKLGIMARGHLKTTTVALYCLWRAVNDPNIRCLFASNSEPNAQKTVHSIRDYVESDKFLWLFPELVPNFQKERWSDSCAVIKREGRYPEGTFEAAGIGTNIIRRHYDLIVEDDTVFVKKDDMTGEEMMPCKEDIEKAVGFHKLTIPLLVDPRTGQRIFIGTRWAEYDAINHILENECDPVNGRYYKVLDLPTRDPDTNKPLYNRFDTSTLNAIEASMGKYLFYMLYLNTVLSTEDRYFKPDNTRYYEEGDLPDDGICRVSIDPADPPSGQRQQHYTGIVTCLDSKKGLFVRGYKFGRYTDAGIISNAFNQADLFGATVIRVEVDRYPHLEAAFKIEMKKRGKYYVIEPVKTRGKSKPQRIRRLQPLQENGLLFLKKGMPELENQMYRYPNVQFVDLLDALSWQVLRDYSAPGREVELKERKILGMEWTFDQIMAGLVQDRGGYPVFDGQYPGVKGRWDSGVASVSVN